MSGPQLLSKIRKRINFSIIFAGCDAPEETRIRERMQGILDPEKYTVHHSNGSPHELLELISDCDGYSVVFVGPYIGAGYEDQRWLFSHFDRWYEHNVRVIAVIDDNFDPSSFSSCKRFTRVNDLQFYDESEPPSFFEVMAIAAARRDSIIAPDGAKEQLVDLAKYQLDGVLTLFDLLNADAKAFAQMLDSKTDDFVSEDLRDGFFNRMLREHILCEVDTKKAFRVDEKRPKHVQGTMDDFAKCYDYHQLVTGHRRAMAEVLGNIRVHFGNTIVDLGCGTAYPMRDFIREAMLKQFEYKLRTEMTRILFIDSNEGMLERASEKLGKLVRDNLSILGGKFGLGVLLADALSVDLDTLARHGFENLDTLLISYVAHWLNDKEGTVRNLSRLVPKDAKVILVEEWPPVVNVSPYMSEELAEKIRASILPIPLPEYFALWEKYSFVPAPSPSEFSAQIDKRHNMYSRVLVKE